MKNLAKKPPVKSITELDHERCRCKEADTFTKRLENYITLVLSLLVVIPASAQHSRVFLATCSCRSTCSFSKPPMSYTELGYSPLNTAGLAQNEDAVLEGTALAVPGHQECLCKHSAERWAGAGAGQHHRHPPRSHPTTPCPYGRAPCPIPRLHDHEGPSPAAPTPFPPPGGARTRRRASLARARCPRRALPRSSRRLSKYSSSRGRSAANRASSSTPPPHSSRAQPR